MSYMLTIHNGINKIAFSLTNRRIYTSAYLSCILAVMLGASDTMSVCILLMFAFYTGYYWGIKGLKKDPNVYLHS